MASRPVDAWLRHQESLYPRSVDLGLARVRQVLDRLQVTAPAGRVITVAGTNGKGSTVTLIHDLLLAAGGRPGLYMSPHLVRYNERIRVAGEVISDAALVRAFEQVELARRGDPLTFFEFGTLAAFVAFAAAGCDTWVLEVGLGGRLDAVNAVDPDLALITTVGLDHQEILGDTVEEIAREKAGILRPGRPVLYGDAPVPAPITAEALRLKAPLEILGRDFGFRRGESAQEWTWYHRDRSLVALPAPPTWSDAQYRNASLVLAALTCLADPPALPASVRDRVLAASRPDGRFQLLQQPEHQWVLDVAHNPQAAAVLCAQLGTLAPVPETTIVLALLSDKVVPAFVRELLPVATRWIVAGLDDPRASTPDRMLRELAQAGVKQAEFAGSPADALELARRQTALGGRIVVCGSFRLVGPALQWLGLY